MITDPPLWLLLISSSFFALVTRSKAAQEKRAPLFWFVIGFLFGLFGLLAFELTKKRSFKTPRRKAYPPQQVLYPKLALGAWYYALNQTVYGPVSQEMIVTLYQEGKLNAHSLLWHESLNEWTTLKTFY
jgi:hypothetical protein